MIGGILQFSSAVRVWKNHFNKGRNRGILILVVTKLAKEIFQTS